MQTLSSELKAVISRRLEAADTDEILLIATALCSEEFDVQVPINGRALPSLRFDVLDSDQVHDHTTGMTWTRGNAAADRLSWADANDLCEGLTVGGHDDWRLPTVKELLTLVDYTKNDPAIDTDFFECESSWYWTSTLYAPSPGGCAWYVYFYSGKSDWGNRNYYGFVRAVRGGQ